MRRWRLILCLAMVAAIGLAAALFLHDSYSRERKLRDGSVLRLDDVWLGKNRPFKSGAQIDRLKDALRNHAPFLRKWKWLQQSRAGAGGWWFTNPAVTHTNEDALWFWISRSAGGAFTNLDLSAAELLDEHGCIFTTTSMGGTNFSRKTAVSGSARLPRFQSDATWLRFEGFPRHDKTFRFRLYSSSAPETMVAEFTVRNPHPTPPETKWTAHPLPVAATWNHASFILTNVVLQTNSDNHRTKQPVSVVPQFTFFENGVPTKEWQLLDTELYDSSGDFSSKYGRHESFLCPWEPAWKLRAWFLGPASPSASNISWSVRGIKMPGKGEFVLLSSEQSLRSEPVALAGPGTFTYSNSTVVSATPEVPIEMARPDQSRRGLPANGTFAIITSTTVSWKTPHVSLWMTNLPRNERLTICVTDDKGRQFYARGWHDDARNPAPGEVRLLQSPSTPGRNDPDLAVFVLDLPEDIKTVDVTFCIHYPAMAEFVFKPPKP